MEYFASEDLKKHIPELRQIIGSPQYKDNRRITSKWDEIIFTLVGIVDSDAVIRVLADVDPILAINSLKYISSSIVVDEELKEYLIGHIARLFEGQDKSIRHAAIATLVEYYDMSEPVLVSIVRRNRSRVVQSSIVEIFNKVRSGSASVIEALKCLSKETGQIRRKAEALLEQLAPEDLAEDEFEGDTEPDLPIASTIPWDLIKQDLHTSVDMTYDLERDVRVDPECRVIVAPVIRSQLDMELRTLRAVASSLEAQNIYHWASFLTYHFITRTQRIIQAKEYYAWGYSEEIQQLSSYTRHYIDLGTIRTTIFDIDGKMMGCIDCSKLLQILVHENESSDYFKRTKKFAAMALGDYGCLEASDELIASLKSSSKRVVMASAQALGKLKVKDAVIPLCRLLHATHFSAEIPMAISIALANIMDDRAIGAVRHMCDHRSQRVKEAASISLLKLEGKI